MALAAHSSTVKIPGTSTAFTGGATTLVSGTTYQLNTAAQRVLDPAVAVTVKDGGTPVAVTSVDYLFGKVTLASAPAGAVTVDANYLPLVSVAAVRDISIKTSATVLDKTTHDDGSTRTRMRGLTDWEATLTALTTRSTDFDGDAGVQTLNSNFGNAVLLEFRPGGTGDYFRGWGVLEALDDKAAVDALHEISVAIKGAARSGTAGTGSTRTSASFGWGS